MTSPYQSVTSGTLLSNTPMGSVPRASYSPLNRSPLLSQPGVLSQRLSQQPILSSQPLTQSPIGGSLRSMPQPVLSQQLVPLGTVPIGTTTQLTPLNTSSPLMEEAVVEQVPIGSIRNKSPTFTLGNTPQFNASLTGLVSPGAQVSSGLTPRTPKVVTSITSQPVVTNQEVTTTTTVPVVTQVPVVTELVQTSPTTVEVSSAEGTTLNPTIETTLMEYGYAPAGKIITSDYQGNSIVRYIKAVNKLGQPVLVEMDTEGYVSVQPNDLTAIESKTAEIVPYTVRMSAQECAGLDVCGVAFECEDAVCTMTSTTTYPEETTFSYVSNRSEKSAVVNGNIVGFPIVRMSEIIANPKLVLELTDSATSRIRNAVHNQILAELEQTRMLLKHVEEDYDKFVNLEQRWASSLASSINELREMNISYVENPPIDEVNREKYRQLLHNLRIRNEMVVKLFEYGAGLAAVKEYLAPLHEGIDTTIMEVDAAFSNVNYILE